MSMRPAALMAFALLTLAQLSGCAEAEPDGLHVWLQNERAQYRALPPPSFTTAADVVLAALPAELSAQVMPHRQSIAPLVEPFSSHRLVPHSPVNAATVSQKVALSASSSSRPKPPLEASPLAAMRLVGSWQKAGQFLALLSVNGLIYAVRVGDRLGEDQGRVSAITLTALELREFVPGPSGHPIERVVSLALVSEP